MALQCCMNSPLPCILLIVLTTVAEPKRPAPSEDTNAPPAKRGRGGHTSESHAVHLPQAIVTAVQHFIMRRVASFWHASLK